MTELATGHGSLAPDSGEAQSWRTRWGFHSPWRMYAEPLNWRSGIYLALAFIYGLALFFILALGIALSLGLVIVWVGVPMFVGKMLLWRGAAKLERQVMYGAFGVRIEAPYRPQPEGSIFAKLKAMVRDPATWKDLAYLLLLCPITLFEAVVTTNIWLSIGVLVTMPLLVALDPASHVDFYFFDFEKPIEGIISIPMAIGLLVIAPYVVRTLAIAHGSFAKWMLGPSKTQLLKARATQLQASRARGVDAAESERRRIERDLHDGAQQQLLAVAMDLGRARAKLETDPDAARELIQQAHDGAKDAIAELRNLARGIYPAILTDRGLDAALSSLAGRAPVPVDVEIDLPERPPAAVETIAYFVVAEALANVAKYARATSASVRAHRDGRWVVIEVSDNGVGGAAAEEGGGLAGLADRAATIDGILTVNSPVGGPTVIRADLPCAW